MGVFWSGKYMMEVNNKRPDMDKVMGQLGLTPSSLIIFLHVITHFELNLFLPQQF